MRFVSVLTLIVVAACTTKASLEDLPIAKKVDEDALLSIPELIEKYGYPAEVHHVESQTGYVLEMHRIPHGRVEGAGPAENKPVVFIMHGLCSSSADWIVAGPEKALGYLLADRGYDVWIGNARGNKYSSTHKTLSPEKAEFWDFSWHEIGVYDLPAMIDYTLAHTNQTKTFYIGHSQGTTAFYVMCAELPQYNSKIRAHFSLAPIAYMNHLFSPLLRFIARFDGPIDRLFKLIGKNSFSPSSGFLAQVGDKLCSENSTTQFICTNVLFVFAGISIEQMNTELLPVIMGHTPAGASTKQFLHYSQLIQLDKGKFRQFDYGSIKNLIKYKSLTPPKYDLTKITAPVALFYSHNDWLAAEVDVLKLYNELANPIGRFLVTDQYFNHLDYLWGNDVDTLVYNKVFSLMTRY